MSKTIFCRCCCACKGKDCQRHSSSTWIISQLNDYNSAKCLCVQEDAACIWKHFPTRALMPGITYIGCREIAAVLPPTCDSSCDWQCIFESFLRLGRGWKFVQISRSCHFLWHSYILLNNTIEAKTRNGKVSWLSAWNIVVQTKVVHNACVKVSEMEPFLREYG